MKRLSFIAIVIFCLASNVFAENTPDPKDLQKIDNSNYFIGKRDNAIKTFVFKEFRNKQLDKQIVFFVDKFPYEANFNLCDTYEKNFPQCDSHIKIYNIVAQKVPYFTRITFVFPRFLDKSNQKLFRYYVANAQDFHPNFELKFS